jgi:hypothetical protein
MTQRLLIGTRKGTFIAERGPAGYRLRLSGHAGVSVNYVAADPHDGTLWAALGFGHWGAKLSMSKDGGQTWNDAPYQVKYPEGARYLAPPHRMGRARRLRSGAHGHRRRPVRCAYA